MLFILIICLIFLLWIVYQISHGELCTPAFLYVAPFILMCSVAFGFQREWGFDLKINTFFVVLTGNICFVAGTYLGNKLRLTNFLKVGTNCNITKGFKVSSWKYFVFILLQIFFYLMKIRYILSWASSHGAGNSISEAIGYYNEIKKFTTDEVATFPAWLSLGLDICTMYGIILACCFALQILLAKEQGTQNRKALILTAVSFVIAAVGESSSGGRGGTVQLAVGLLATYIILYQRKYNWKKKLPFKYIAKIAVALIGVVILFCASITWLGRDEIHLFGRYLSTYVGAQIFNLDYFLNTNYESSVIFGQETFYPLVQRIASILGISKWSNYHVGYDSVYAAGFSTGNVYTAFYTYIIDFGYIGVIILPFLFGLFSQIVYRHARKSPTVNPINIGMVFYSNLSYIIAFAFFADKFGSLVFTINMIKKLFILWLVMLFMFRFEFNGTKIRIQIKPKRSSLESKI